jgi:transposase
MVNQLKMAIIQAVLQLHASGWSQRRIARELGLHRETVARVLRQSRRDPKPAKAPSGSDGSKPATVEGSPAPESVAGFTGPAESDSKPATAPSGSEHGSDGTTASSGLPEPAAAPLALDSRSQCAAFRAVILELLERRLSGQRIYQDLVTEHGYAGSYYSVRRFVRKLGAAVPLPFRRLECGPAAEAQIDYGRGAPVVTPEGRRRKTHVLRVVLSHSRKAYSEVSYRQTTEDFIRCLENAFWYFGGVPETLVVDNLKAAVLHPDWFDPELNPKLREFSRYYGTVILPTKPRMPRHKGKVERGIGYVKSNALQGRTFTSLEEQNGHLLRWEATVADTRIHGTTRQHVGAVFAQVERAALRPLPAERFPFFHEGQRQVNRDGHVEVDRAYYSVPPEYLGRTVWVRWDGRLVRVFNDRQAQIAVHARHERGRFSTQGAHIAAEKISGLERGARWLLERVGLVGPHSRSWAEALVQARGIEGTRVLQGLLALTKKHESEALESACQTALSHGEFRLRAIRKLLAQQSDLRQAALPFLEDHPLIRPLADYAQIVAAAAQRQERAF